MKKFLSLLAPATASAGLLQNLLGESEITKEMYQSGEVHEALMDYKMSSWESRAAAGAYNSTQYKVALAGPVKCVDGLATAEAGNPLQTFRCSNLDLYDFKTHAELGSSTGSGSGSWGWVAPDGREFVAVGQADGAAFAEVTKEGQLVYLGRLPQQSVTSQWREIRTVNNYFIIGSEAQGHNIQIFDATKLLDLDPASPKVFSTTSDISLFTDLPIGRSHNVVSLAEKNFAASVGAQPRNSSCRSGIILIDLADPANPTSPGCAPGDGYVHDAECLVYRGPDSRYQGRDVCYGYNEDSLTIYDVTDKSAPSIISVTSYTGASYTHQGSVLDPNNQEFIILDDELDEEEGAGSAADGFPVTYIWDIRDLEAPVQTGIYKSSVRSIDHNQYVFKGLAFQSNYGAGLRVLDVSSIPQDPTGAGVSEVAFFDIFPEDDAQPGGGAVEFTGTWSHYAGFPSGNILINTIERGAYVVKNSAVTGQMKGQFA